MSPIERSGGGGGGGFANPMTTAGDLIIENAVPAPARLGIGSAGQVLGIAGGLPHWASPPGLQLDYVQITATVTITSTTDGLGGGDAIIDGNSVTYDGATLAKVEFYSPALTITNGIGNVDLYDGTTNVARMGTWTFAGNNTMIVPVYSALFLTPTAGAHTFHVRGWKNAVGATYTLTQSTGGSATFMPAWYRVTVA